MKKKAITILIADDEQSARNGFAQYLSSYYENILEAKDGLEAFNIYKENKVLYHQMIFFIISILMII